jgi:hypothetical protein
MHSITNPPIATMDTAITRPLPPAEPTPAPRHRHPTNREASTADNRATTATRHLHLVSTVVVHHNIKPKEAMAKVNTEDRSNNIPDMDLRPALADRAVKTMEEPLQADTANKLDMVDLRKAIMAAQVTTTTTSTTR